MSRANYKAQDFINAIPGSGGIISTIAGRVGCSWHTAKKYISDYQTVQQAYDDECEKVTDLAESTVIKAIKDGDTGTAKWYLTYKGHGRGYIPTQRQTVDIDANINTDNDYRADLERRLIDIIAARAASEVPGEPESE
jgi:hypothetical protein